MSSRHATLGLPVERPVTILVVDDDARVVELLEIAFGAHGWRVVRAGDGEQAIRLVATESPDLVVLDVRLPRRNGLDVCEALRRDPATADVPVILVSALADTDARIQGLTRGADDYLAKPFSPKELVARVKRMLARSREARNARRLGTEAEIELARARDEAQRQHQERRHAERMRQTCAALARDLARRGDRDDLASAFLLALDTHLATGLSALLLPGEDERWLEPAAERGAGAERLLGLALQRDGELARWVDGLGRVVRVAELERFADELRDEWPAVAAAGITLLAPIVSRDGLEGLLALDDKRDGTDLSRAEGELLAALLEELAGMLAQQRRLETQAAAIEALLRALADRAGPQGIEARAEAAAWIARVARERSGSWRRAARIECVVRLGDWMTAAGSGAVADAAQRDVTGHAARLAALAEQASCGSGPEDAALVRAGWAWSAARGAGASPDEALARALEPPGLDAGLAAALRQTAPRSDRHAPDAA